MVPAAVATGTAPAPPPYTTPYCVSAADDANVPEAVYARTPPEVPAVSAVPPLATGNAVPEYVIASVPDDVIGLPDMLKILGTEAATLVTVPLVAGLAHEGAPAVVAVRT